MKYTLIITLIALSLLVSACSAAGQPPADATPTAPPNTITDGTISAEEGELYRALAATLGLPMPQLSSPA